MTNAEEADRLSRRRARILPVLGLFLVIQQATFFTSPEGRMRTVDLVHAAAWVLLASVILGALTTGGFWFTSRAVRELIDDDVTRANRASALEIGFVGAMAVAIALYAVEAFAPTILTASQTIHAIVTAGLFTALLRFAMLERRALA
jgi:hypothetical protein